MPRDNLPLDHRAELVRKFREAADALDTDRAQVLPKLALLDVKLFLLAALNDCDRALEFGKSLPGLDTLLGGNAND